MKFLSLCDYQRSPQDILYRYPVWVPVSFLAFFVLVAVGLGIFVSTLPATTEPVLFYYLIGLCVVSMWFTRGAISARLGPQNWLLTTSFHGITIKFRSFRNSHFLPSDSVIAYISYSEIEWVRKCVQKKSTPDDDRGVTESVMKMVEIRLRSPDAIKLEALIREEINRKGPVIKTWYGHTCHHMVHYPVRMVADETLRIEWRVSPGIKAFLQSIVPHVKVVQPHSTHEEYTVLALRQLDKSQQEERIGKLAKEGDTLSATKLVRELYACSLTEARKRVEQLKAAQPR